MLLIGAGVGLFGMKGSHKAAAKLANPNTGLGYALCLVNLAFDGYTNAAQVGLVAGAGALAACTAVGAGERMVCG